MTNDDRRETAYGVVDREGRNTDGATPVELEVFQDDDADTVTFAKRMGSDSPSTTAWMTANTAIVVDLSEAR